MLEKIGKCWKFPEFVRSFIFSNESFNELPSASLSQLLLPQPLAAKATGYLEHGTATTESACTADLYGSGLRKNTETTKMGILIA